ncbi:MAG: hypothetical protein FJ288_00770 [Planctomycetes bacterium]|nr:hypothetical protein [Planctomycetota bacterium]
MKPRNFIGVCVAAAAGMAAAYALAFGSRLYAALPAPEQRASAPDERAAASAEGVALLVLPIAGDEVGLGEQVRLMLINKARRLGAVVYDPGSVAEALDGQAAPADTPPDKLAALGRDRFKADLVVAGCVKGNGPYSVRLVAVRTGIAKQPLVLDKTYTCAYHQIIPLEMAKAVYGILGLKPPDDPLRMLREDAEVERRWRDGPNLVRNAGLETANAAGTGPADWQPLEKQMAWVPNPDGPGKVLKYDMDEATAASYGLDFYSDWIDIEAGATYRFSCRYKSEGPTPKVFLKGYHAFPPQEGFPADRRETYRRQVHPGGEKGRWNTVAADFIPESARPDQRPTFLKVDLYAYWPKGVIYWDDIVLKKVRDSPPPAPSPGAK